MAIGRPTVQTEAIVDEIMRDLSDGITLREITRRDHMPNWRTVYDWLDASPELSARFARAREKGFDAIAEECLDIAEDGSNDWMTRRSSAGVDYETLDQEHVQRSKLRIDTRLKLLAKWSPRRYGELMKVAATTPEGEPAGVAITVSFVEPPKTTGEPD